MKHTINIQKSLRLSIIFAIFAITTIVTVVILFQRNALKKEASQETFSTIEELLLNELSNTSKPIEQQLIQLQSWGKEGLFDNVDQGTLTTFLKPILENIPQAYSIIFAQDDNSEVLIYRDSSGSCQYKYRSSFTKDGDTASDVVQYLPTRRPWFKGTIRSVDSQNVHWTVPYRFKNNGEMGLTASISWKDRSGRISVIAIDVLLSELKKIITTTTVGNGGKVFFINKNYEIFDLSADTTYHDSSRTLFRRIDVNSDPIILDILHRDFRKEKKTDDGLYYLKTSSGRYWVKIDNIDSILPQFALIIIAPEKGLNKEIERKAFFLNVFSAIIVAIGFILVSLIMYHSLYALRLINNVGELNQIFSNSSDISSFLSNTVITIADFMKVPVCSIYLLNEKENKLILEATTGLNGDLVGKVSIEYGEGLVGMTLKQLKPLRVIGASRNRNFHPVIGLNEEKYDSFLGVPILRGTHKIGVLVVQKKGNRSFNNQAVQTLEILASQLTTVLETAGTLLSFYDDTSRVAEKTADELNLNKIVGKVASPGYAIGQICVNRTKDSYNQLKNRDWDDSLTLDDFNKAVEKTSTELEKLQLAVEERLEDGAAMIFASHLLMLKDTTFTGEMRKHIENDIPVHEAIFHVADELIRSFAISTNTIIKEKVNDIKDLTIRILSNLSDEFEKEQIHKDKILIARELFPSDILIMASEGVKGIILISGGATSHLSILCRSLNIPLVLHTDTRILSIKLDTKVLLDANTGIVYFSPSKEIIESYRPIIAASLAQPKATHHKETFTECGTKISLMANVNLVTDIADASHQNIEGIGLYRSEFPFMVRDSFPSEYEQFAIYKKVADYVKHKEMTFRTLDIGGDKVLTYKENQDEPNPFLGLRAIRFSLQEKELFRQQLRAVLKAGINTKLRIMFPMIQSLDEFLEAKGIVKETIEELQSKGIMCHPTPQIGMMVELPSAVTLIDKFAEVADFVSIGTNDLIQYLLGVDRTNSEVAPLYKPYHPTVLRSIAKVAEIAPQYNCDVSVCGDMASNTLFIPFLIGCGIRKLSVDPVYIPKVQKCINETSVDEAQQVASKLLDCSTIKEARAIIYSKKEG